MAWGFAFYIESISKKLYNCILYTIGFLGFN
jgi:hypothetical protein